MSAVPAEDRSPTTEETTVAPPAEAVARRDGTPWLWWAIAALFLVSVVEFLLSEAESGVAPTASATFFRAILPIEILVLMILGKAIAFFAGPLTATGARILRIAVPIGMLALLIANWQFYVVYADVPHYILPSPWRVTQALFTDWGTLSSALLVTLGTTLTALILALVGGVFLAIIMAESRWIELAVYPYAVILQVTPIVAIAPLILIYAPTTNSAVLICAWIVAFFPVLSNMTQGLRSTDHNLLNLFELYGASRWQTLIRLKIPNAMPYFLAGLRIAGGLALIAAVVGEFAAGSVGSGSGLAFRLIESQYRLNIPRLFAALVLLSFTGIVIFLATSLVSHLLLRKWHESAVRREN